MPLRLKSLELHGYKTFASRTLFEFAGTVTAIVGPNGSGKSNIADSLRWVLGEQSYNLLRGKKTEDMIFSGSEQRPRAGMASATITFDNWDGWLPIDFGEVAITRRAYRDGQNEYLINGQRVRLKDVSELLAQSGLAERTYTIIGQGLVDAALALKAEERRRLFEEAAGIGLHRARREEALHRLDLTRRNLERVQDILAELQPRLRSLERQARRAQEYEQVRADLQVLLREWYGYHWHRAQKELTAAREVAHTQEVSLDQARAEQTALAEQLAEARERIQGLRASLNSWHRQSSQQHARRETLSRDLAVAEERRRALLDQQQVSQRELARLEEEAGYYREQLASAEEQVKRSEEEYAEARAQSDAARLAMATRQDEREKVEKAIQSTQQSISALNSRLGQLQARQVESQAQAERRRAALDTAFQSTRRAENTVQELKERQQAAQNAWEEANKSHQSLQEAIHAHEQRQLETGAIRKEILEQRAEIANRHVRLKTQREVLEQAESAFTGYQDGTRLLLNAAHQDRLSGVHGALSQFLDVPAEYETAIAAALGEYLDAVILQDGLDQALDLLGEGSAHGVLLPLKMLKPAGPWSALSGARERIGEGILGVASDLVRAPAELRPAVDLLLGSVLIVRDRRAAHLALAHLNRGIDMVKGDEQTAVPSQALAITLRGEAFLAQGPVLFRGSGAESNGQTVLSRQRRLRELSEELQAVEQQLAAQDDRIRQVEEDLRTLQAEGERLGRELRGANQVEEKAASDVNKARLALEQAERQARWQQEQIEGLQAEINQAEVEAGQISKALEQVERESRQARERLREQNAILANLSLDDFQAQVSHWNTLAAVAERALADSKSRWQERLAALDRTLRSQQGFQERLEQSCSAVEELDRQKISLRQAEGEIGQEIEALRKLIEPAENELDGFEREQISLQKSEAAARQALSLAEHHHAQAKIGLARRQEALDSLRRRIEDDFGLVAFEYVESVSGPTPLPLGGMVEQLPFVSQISSETEEAIKRQRAQLRRIGAINPDAQTEYLEVKQRYAFMTSQIADLEKAEAGVRQVIAELDSLMENEFRKTFDAVASEFKSIFTRLFDGGSARLVLTNPEDLTDTGIDIEARLPGRRTQGLSLLSGGERSLTATSLVFALLKVSPTPFCVLDEVDAMLDEANVGRFRELLRELSQNTQFVVVTHNRNTVQVADVIYGVTMGRDSSSQILSLKLDEVSQVVEA